MRMMLKDMLSKACKIANTMTQGMMQINCIDDMCKSILGELCNMISGNFQQNCQSLVMQAILSHHMYPYSILSGRTPESVCARIVASYLIPIL